MDFRPVEIGTILRLLIFFTARPSYAVDIIELWDSTKTSNNLYEWKEYLKTCEIREVCPKDSEQCMGDKILWEDLGIQLQNSTEIVIMDDQNFQEAKDAIILSSCEILTVAIRRAQSSTVEGIDNRETRCKGS